jgi:hypothetical protein
MGTAISYALGQWESLVVYLENLVDVFFCGTKPLHGVVSGEVVDGIMAGL